MTATAIEKRIFVVGVPRSGTTLVQSLLAAHRGVTSFTESHFFSRHFRLLPGLDRPVLTRDPGPRAREFLAENEIDLPADLEPLLEPFRGPRLLLAHRTEEAARLLLRLLDAAAVARGESTWIEKTPRHLCYLPWLEHLCGTQTPLHFVHVIREGLPVVASLHEASKQWERAYDLETCARRWNEGLAISLDRAAQGPGHRDHFVFYEELTAAPDRVLRNLLAGLGLRWEDDLFERYAASSPRLVTRAETWKAQVGQRVSAAGSKEHLLSAEQKRRALHVLDLDRYQKLRERARRSESARADA